MKKAAIVLILTIVTGCLLIGAASPTTYDSVDRSPEIRYPSEQYEWLQKAYVFYKQDRYFHSDVACDFIVTDHTDFLQMSRYEAVERGFLPCPNCVFEKVDVRRK